MAAQVAFDLTPEPVREVEPTIIGRVHTYDLIRGVAILGILLANIPYFAGPSFAEADLIRPESSPTDFTVSALTTAFVAGKFRSMLALLFGIGMWMQFEKRNRVEGNWPWGYVKRMLLLAVFGLLHWIFIWPGDILLIYSVGALATFWWVGNSDKFHRRCIASIGMVAAVIGVLTLVAGIGGESLDDVPDTGGLTLAAEKAAFASGSYIDQLQFRAQVFAEDAALWLIFIPFLAGLYFLGMQFGRYRTLEDPRRTPRTGRAMLLLGLGVGLPLNVLAASFLTSKNDELIGIAVELFFAPLLSVGLIMLLAIWGSSDRLGSVQLAIAKVGRTAFSCYIMQSLICTSIFYSWGGGLFGKLDRLESLMVVPIVWAANLLFAHLWLKKYTMGPLEWLWRSWTEGRKLPIRLRVSH